uniref:TFIID subunit TAF5 NTD2 domain-containing protein n=1 Tax=Strigamia maritima TaxID=126957 RepID=T1J6X2_STRMM
MKLAESLQEMATRGLINNDCSKRNVINYSLISNDSTVIDQQFVKLKTFISDAAEPYKSELTYILYPMFVHLYLDLIHNSQKNIAQKFYQRHNSLFLPIPNYSEIIETLKKISSFNDLNQHVKMKDFRHNKYVIYITEDALQYLLKFLSETDNLLLLQTFNLYIEIKEPPSTNLHLAEEKDQATNETASNNADNASQISKPAEQKSSSDAAMKSLAQAIKKVRDGPLASPSVCLYTLMNTARGVSCAHLNEDVSLLVSGGEDSSIQLWNLNQQANGSTSVSETNNSKLQLGCDYNEKLEDKKLYNEETILRGHSGSVYGLCFTPDSQLLLSCSEDTTVRAWDMQNFNNVAIYRGHNYPVWDIDYSSIGIYFATASHDRTAKLWTLDRTYPIRYFAGHSLDVDSIRFHPNCNYIATGSSDKSVRLWSVQEGKLVRMFQGHRGTIFALAFSPDGQFLASAGEDRRVKIWDLAAGTLFKELRGHFDSVYSLCFSRDSSILVSGGLDSNIRIWDIRRGVSYNTSTDGHTSPELIGSCAAKSINTQQKITWLQLVCNVRKSSSP